MVHNEMGKYAIASTYFDRAIELATSIGMKENIRIGYFNRSISHEKRGNHLQALADYKAYKSTEDSIFSEAKSRQIEEMRTIYEIERKEQEIALQKNEIQLLEEKDKFRTLQLTGLMSGIAVLIAVFGLIYFAMHQKMKRRQLEKEVVDKELAFKRKELTTHALHLANKNEILEGLKEQIDELKNGEKNAGAFNKISNTIRCNLQDDKNWENFSKYFEQVHRDFNAQVKKKYPEVTPNELRLMALLKMNLSSKEIANILNISSEGIKKARYRLRKKMNITTDDSLQDLILGL
jgi:DNA-binding CsgD family transcriptional regulator